MILLEHSTYDAHSISANLGAPEYSYWFVRKCFGPLLHRFGIVVPVANPEREVDAIFRSAREHGQACAFLAFNPPQYAPVDLDCPTIPVFAWEFDRIPDETWNANPREDWRYVFARTGLAITHSSESVAAVRRAMGDGFPIWSIPAPVFDRAAARATAARGWVERCELVLGGALAIETGAVDLSLFSPDRLGEGVRALRLLRGAASDPKQPPRSLHLHGVVYTAVFNPGDGRKNWTDMLGGFVWAFRATPDATLVLKLSHSDMLEGLAQVLEHMSKLGPFDCRIVLIHGMLSDDAYDALVDATSYAVNTSDGEGQCLPLMEFMSAGRPAVAPRHTAMMDYVSDENAFVLQSRTRQSFWPHDQRQAIRCLRQQISFSGLVTSFRQSYAVAKHDPQRYARMSAAATAALAAYCSDDVATTRLAEVFGRLGLFSGDEPADRPYIPLTAQKARA